MCTWICKSRIGSLIGYVPLRLKILNSKEGRIKHDQWLQHRDRRPAQHVRDCEIFLTCLRTEMWELGYRKQQQQNACSSILTALGAT